MYKYNRKLRRGIVELRSTSTGKGRRQILKSMVEWELLVWLVVTVKTSTIFLFCQNACFFFLCACPCKDPGLFNYDFWAIKHFLRSNLSVMSIMHSIELILLHHLGRILQLVDHVSGISYIKVVLWFSSF